MTFYILVIYSFCFLFKVESLIAKVGMTIFSRPAGTRPGPTLMGRVLPSPFRNRVGYGFKKKKKNPKQVRVL